MQVLFLCKGSDCVIGQTMREVLLAAAVDAYDGE